ncbi:ferritin family protein [Rhodoblastus acidophilus]|uniref:Ferritin family protein n=1 Tax=Candidatus Rhodoblastus alkanivorans TaxID=2954117 RepID=A0ABS9Z2W0_9HYPH|nr:ferritin family protein [Candidatus Rhodoblastus alkanivorans]MCI4677421.1 ferritin family protein [Candidatus Rhodoblastus alkanivorans]MCI4681780.1 ferritin family protein [Candidatus Rhodoblastus alkanivorans]MDI4642829.1 ferritin family protein [Rhodoblastus acidophilus]
MGDTGQVNVRVGSTDDLLSLAEALEQEAAARYRSLAARMARQGDAELAAQFESLAKMEDRHAEQIGERGLRMSGRAPKFARAKWETPPGYDEDEARGAELSAYHALAFAVRNEERAFAFYSYVAAEAENAEIRALAEEMASEELQHAALLRQFRRRAFRQQRPATIETPQDIGELRALARRWDAEAAAAHAALADALDAIGETSDARIFRRLAEDEKLSAEGAAAARTRTLRGAADGLRALEESFDRYASIAERAKDEKVVAEAQKLAGRIVARLALAGGARRNTLLIGEKGP